MGKLRLSKMLDSLCLAFDSNTCFCVNSAEGHEDEEEEDEVGKAQERKPLFVGERSQVLRIKDVVSTPQSLAFMMKPKVPSLSLSRSLSLILHHGLGNEPFSLS